MARRRHTPEQVINKLREAEVATTEGSTVAGAARRIGVTGQTFYRWRSEYGGLRIDQARRLMHLESENSRLKRAVADLTLDNQILRKASEGNSWAPHVVAGASRAHADANATERRHWQQGFRVPSYGCYRQHPVRRRPAALPGLPIRAAGCRHRRLAEHLINQRGQLRVVFGQRHRRVISILIRTGNLERDSLAEVFPVVGGGVGAYPPTPVQRILVHGEQAVVERLLFHQVMHQVRNLVDHRMAVRVMLRCASGAESLRRQAGLPFSAQV